MSTARSAGAHHPRGAGTPGGSADQEAFRSTHRGQKAEWTVHMTHHTCGAGVDSVAEICRIGSNMQAAKDQLIHLRTHKEEACFEMGMSVCPSCGARPDFPEP